LRSELEGLKSFSIQTGTLPFSDSKGQAARGRDNQRGQPLMPLR
jgi:hypothetical protein